MEFEKTKVIEKIKEGKEYGLSYSKLAKEIGVSPTTVYLFINGTYNLAKTRQLKALCAVEKYIDATKEQLRIIEHKGLCVK